MAFKPSDLHCGHSTTRRALEGGFGTAAESTSIDSRSSIRIQTFDNKDQKGEEL